jgi:hypothetical protein
VALILTGTSAAVRKDLETHGLVPPAIGYAPTIQAALRGIRVTAGADD